MRADGGVNGLTLAERVANGANGAVVSEVSAEPSLFDKRNAKIAAAAVHKLGNNRVGDLKRKEKLLNHIRHCLLQQTMQHQKSKL